MSEGVGTSANNGHELFLTIWENSPAIEYVIDPKTYEILSSNRRAREIFGESLMGEACYKALHGFSKPCEFCESDETLEEGGKAHTWESHNQLLDKHFLITDQIVEWPGRGNVRLEIAIDVTKRKRAEDELRRSETRFRELTEMLPETIFETDKNLNLTYSNRRAFELFGYTREDLKRLNGLEMLAPEERDRAGENLARRLKGQDIGLVEYQALKRNGTTFPMLLHLSPTIHNGEVAGFKGIVIDITERKRTEEALSIKDMAIDAALNGFALADLDGNFTYVNKAFLEMWGYDNLEEVVGTSSVEIAESEEKALEVMLEVQEKGRWMGEVEVRKKDGTPFTILFSASTVTNRAGEPVSMMSSFVDITERKRAEERLTATMAELRKSNEELEHFAYIASHDLQEPLRMVTSYVQLIEKRYADRLDRDGKEFIDYAVDGATRMKQLINDLLSYSRINTKGVEFKKAGLDAVLDDALRNLEILIRENDARITCDRLPVLDVDYSQLVRVFQNLVGNAIKFRKDEETPVIHIGVKEKRDGWKFSVSDNGIGIEKDYFEKIFAIFQRLHGDRTRYDGTGMGLAISKRIVERHGGEMWVGSDPGKGSTFHFTLPKR